MKYSVEIPNGWKMNLAMIKDPVEAYEAMTNVAKTASVWPPSRRGIAKSVRCG